jgi:hypothetical protein
VKVLGAALLRPGYRDDTRGWIDPSAFIASSSRRAGGRCRTRVAIILWSRIGASEHRRQQCVDEFLVYEMVPVLNCYEIAGSCRRWAGASADGAKNFAIAGIIIRITSHQVDHRSEERLERASGGYRL